MMSQAPIIVGGFYRSGTSLVRRLLDSHSNIHCPPEIKFMKDFYGDYLKDDLAHVRFFKTVRALGLEEGELLNVFGKAYIQARESACLKLGKKRWADKNPENVLYLNRWDELLAGDLMFVFVVRNPLDTLASLNEIRFKKTVPADFESKVLCLKDFYQNAMTYAARYPQKSITLKYEDIVSHPVETMRILFKRLGERYEAEVLELFHEEKRRSGIEDPKVGNTREVHSNSVDRWRSDLTKEQINMANNHLSEIIEHFGYMHAGIHHDGFGKE